MKKIKSMILMAGICAGSVSAFAEEAAVDFIPMVFWGEQGERGVIVGAPREMTPVDSKGNKFPKIIVEERISAVAISPDGGSIAYITPTGLWLINADGAGKVKVYSGACDSVRWNRDGSGVMFFGYEKMDGPTGGYRIKLFWADGGGKNLKQVYP